MMNENQPEPNTKEEDLKVVHNDAHNIAIRVYCVDVGIALDGGLTGHAFRDAIELARDTYRMTCQRIDRAALAFLEGKMEG